MIGYDQYTTLAYPYKYPIGSITFATTEYIMKKLEQFEEEGLYTFEDKEEIIRFLIKNPDLIQELYSAHQLICKVFGECNIDVKLYKDPEENTEEILIVIKSKNPPEKILELYERLFEDWYIKIMDKVFPRLDYTVETT